MLITKLVKEMQKTIVEIKDEDCKLNIIQKYMSLAYLQGQIDELHKAK